MRTGSSLASLIACAAPLAAQETVATLDGPPDTDLGSAVACIGDVNGDGFPDVVVGLPRATTSAGGFSGRVRVYSGAFLLQGTLPDVLREWDGNSPGARFGCTLAGGGDVDADGIADLAVGAVGDDQGGLTPDGGSVSFYSGASGALLCTHYSGAPFAALGTSVAFVGDVNGDGFDDAAGGMVCTCAGPIDPGHAVVWSGEWIARTAAGQSPVSARVLHFCSGAALGDEFGAALAAAGDLDADGFADFAVGARRGSATQGGYVRILSGASGAVLATLQGDKPYDFFGAALAPAGDANGDGWPDLAIGAPGADLGLTGVDTNFGAVSVLSGEWVARVSQGQTPATACYVLYAAGPSPGDALGVSLATLGDLDLDGGAELAAGALQAGYGPTTGPGYVEVLSGKSGALLWRRSGTVTGERCGASLAGAGDLDLDGVSDLLAGAPASSAGGVFSGRLRVHAGFDLVGTPFCVALPNSTGVAGSIQGRGSPSLAANRLLLTAEGLVPGSNGLFFYGTGQGFSPLGNGNLCIGGAPLQRLAARATDAAGRLALALDLAAPPGLFAPGATWNFQAFYRDAPAGGAGFNLSDALAVRFRP